MTTGRKPNEPVAQNIPIRTELGKQIRDAFTKRQPGEVFIRANYAPLELRLYYEFGGDHDKHDTKAPSCMFCDAGIPKREVTIERRGNDVVVKKGPLK